jgi:hypothetical protein
VPPGPVQPPSATELKARGRASSDLWAGVKQLGREQRDGTPIRSPQADRRRARLRRTEASRDLSLPLRARRRSIDAGKSLGRKVSSGIKHFKQMMPNPLGTPERVTAALDGAAPGPERRALIADLVKAVCQQTLGPTLRIPRTPETTAALEAGMSEQQVAVAFVEAQLSRARDSAQTVIDSADEHHRQDNTLKTRRLLKHMNGVKSVAETLLEGFQEEIKKGNLNGLYPLHLAPPDPGQ